MQSQRSLVLSAVNLNGHSSSAGFIGYFERSGRYKNGMEDIAVSFFLKDLGAIRGEWTLVSSLHANEDELGHFGDAKSDARDLSLVDFLCANGVLRRFSYNARFGTDYESDTYDEAVRNASLDFVTLQVDSLEYDVLLRLLCAPMLVYGLQGYCFLISTQKGLILYPHDDTGFGVIGYGEHQIEVPR